MKCSYGFYFNSEDICTKIPDECKRFSEENEKCVECYDGYELDSDDKCIKKKEEVSDPNCNEFKNGKCLKCSYGFYFNDEDICTHIPDECLDFRIE